MLIIDRPATACGTEQRLRMWQVGWNDKTATPQKAERFGKATCALCVPHGTRVANDEIFGEREAYLPADCVD